MSKILHPTFQPVLIETKDAAPGVRLFRFLSPTGFRFTPGQFLMFHFTDDEKIWRAYSICSSPAKADEYFEVTVGMVGDFSDRLAGLQPHAEGGLVVRGPFGKWVYDGATPHVVLVSGGTGLTPFRAMCRLKVDLGLAGRITVCASAKSPEGLLYRDEYALWKRHGISVNEKITQTSALSEWKGATGRWTGAEIFAAANDAAAVYYLCGPNKMVQELREGLERLGVALSNIRTEKWGDYTDLF
ncbi:MAG: FAD-dependent oxidoreductase [Phycisphaerales bacterium]|nr:FAD-dependent oxidoreductase [Phycisphaerales bacterium]